MVIHVVKVSGEIEPLDINKVREACLRAGASQEAAELILNKLRQFVYEGISTKEIYGRVFKLLEKYAYPSAIKFGLKEAIMRMGPTGFPFETYISQILKQHGYRTRTNAIIRGSCVNHEIDIIVEEESHNGNKRYMVECKYHNASGIYTGLKETLYTYARLLDLKEGSEKGLCEPFDGAWLITNTKISADALNYGICRDLRLIGWRYPPKKGLEKFIEEKNLYPITILKSIDKKSLQKFSRAGIMLLKDLEGMKLKDLSTKTQITQTKLTKILNDIKRVTI